MTTPTRDQLIEQAIQGHAGTRMAMQWLFDQAIKAGRAQGLREAKEVCEGRSALRHLPANHFEIERSTEARSCAAAIEQLRGE